MIVKIPALSQPQNGDRSYWLQSIQDKINYILKVRKEEDEEYEKEQRMPQERWWGFGTPYTPSPVAPVEHEEGVYPSEAGTYTMDQLLILRNGLLSGDAVELDHKDVAIMTMPQYDET